MRVLGLDIGEKRIGVAISDPEGIIASPLATVEDSPDESALAQIVALARKHEVGRIVAGLPRSLDGTIGSQALSVEKFLRMLEGLTDVPVTRWDERFSTAAANRMMAESGVKKRKKKEKRDSLAAVFILQGYLESRRE